MIILLNEFWPWLLIGSCLVVWGVKIIGFSASDWLRFVLNLIYMPLLDDTKVEKKQLNHPSEEIASANPGCALIIAGTLFVFFGVVRWLT